MDRFEDAKLRILEGTDLVALIESYMPLRPRGNTLVALCPFHAESTPSFTVYRDKQFFKCYGCGKHGDAFTWLMERDGLTFREAMEQLADTCGVSLEGVFKKGREGGDRGPKARTAYEALGRVAEWLHQQLLQPAGKLARDYLDERGLGEAIAPWQLGYHPIAGEVVDGADAGAGGASLLAFAREQQLPLEVLEQAGLLKNGREPYAGRLIFPIVDERGRTVAFGGRIVPGAPGSEPRPGSDYKPPKYLNSPESPLFHKRRVLYGLHAAKQAGERRLVVMEGYTDVIACHLAGFRGAVASLGTAFTAEHARTVERYADQGLVLMFDGDRAGRQAAERAQRELVNSRLAVRVAIVGGEGAKDPADVVLARPGEDEELVVERRARFADLIDGAQDAMSVWFRLLRQRLDLTQAVDVEKAARECASLLELVEVPVRRAALTNEMARHLSVPPQTLKQLVRPRRAGAAPAAAAAAPEGGAPVDDSAPWLDENGRPIAGGSGAGGGGGGGTSGGRAAGGRVGAGHRASEDERAENQLLECVLARPELLVRLDLDEAPLQVPEVAQLFEWAFEAVSVGRDDSSELFRYLFSRAADQPELRALLGRANDVAEKMREPEAVFDGTVDARRRKLAKADRRTLREQYLHAVRSQDLERAAELQAQMTQQLRRELPRNNGPADASPQRRRMPGDRPSFLDPSSGSPTAGNSGSSGEAGS